MIDKSALVRLHLSGDRGEWLQRIDRGLVRIAVPTVLEVGYSAIDAEDWHANLAGRPLVMMPIENATPATERRAVDVQGLLAGRGQHRAPSIPDLLVAAAAEIKGLTLLHLDKDFELIAEVTGQPIERLRLAE